MLPEADESETSPRQVVADALRYLKNQPGSDADMTNIAGWGCRSCRSHVESTVKQFNRRVKGRSPGARGLSRMGSQGV